MLCLPTQDSFDPAFNVELPRQNQRGAVESDSIRVYSRQISDLGRKENDDCAICFEPLTKDSRRLANCDHAFHEKCLKGWVRSDKRGKSRTCPICRVEVDVKN